MKLKIHICEEIERSFVYAGNDSIIFNVTKAVTTNFRSLLCYQPDDEKLIFFIIMAYLNCDSKYNDNENFENN